MQTDGIRSVNIDMDNGARPVEVLAHVELPGGVIALRRQGIEFFLQRLLGLAGLDPSGIADLSTRLTAEIDRASQADADLMQSLNSATSRLAYAPNRKLWNYDSQLLRSWRTGRAAVKNKVRRARILILDDSTGRGVGEGPASSWPAHLADLLTASGYPAVANGIIGNGGNVSTTFDPRLVYGSGWGVTNTPTVGGFLMFGNAGGTGSFSFRPTNPVDTFEVWFSCNGSTGSLQANIDGGAGTAVGTSASAAAVVKKTFTAGSVGLHTLNLTDVTGSAVYIVGFNAFDSTKPGIDILNGSSSGGKASDLVSGSDPWSGLQLLPKLGVDLTIPGLGVNDAGAIDNGTLTAATFLAQMGQILSACGGSILMKTCVPSSINGGVSAASQLAVNVAQYSLAQSRNIPLIDVSNALGSYNGWDQNATYGLMFDRLHPSGAGNADIAKIISEAVCH
jgi:lysophospholipase L1-like esterase